MTIQNIGMKHTVNDMSETPGLYTVTETPLPYELEEDPFTDLMAAFRSAEYQPQGIDLTIYCGVGGISFEKPRSNEVDFAFIQVGIGTTVSRLLDEQIAACVNAGKPFGFFHLPSAYDDSAKEQARWAIDQMTARGFGGRVLMADLEPADSDKPSSMLTSDQAYIYMQEIEQYASRRQLGYSNPNHLLYTYRMPYWLPKFLWCIAQYPAVYGYFHTFKQDYEWQDPPRYWDKYPLFKEQFRFWQFTKNLRAKEYFSVDRLPNGGDGLNSGDGYLSLLDTIETIDFIMGDETVPPPPEPPEDPALVERVTRLEEMYTLLTGQVKINTENLADLYNTVAGHETRIQALEASTKEPTITVTAKEGVPAMGSIGNNAKGKPIVTKNVYTETGDPALKWEAGATIKVYEGYADTDSSFVGYRIAEDVDHHGYEALYVKADKVQP